MSWLDKIRSYLIYTVAVMLIVLAVAFSVLRAVLPHATGYVSDVEQALAEQIGLPVSIASMDADMYWLVPRLKLLDVVIYSKDKQHELLRLDEAFFALAFVDSLLQLSLAVGDVSLVGADLSIERYAEKRWRIQGIEFGGDDASSEADDSLNEFITAIKSTSLSLLESNIHWNDFRLSNGSLDFVGVNIFIEEFLGSHSIDMSFQLPEDYGNSLRLVLKTDDDIFHPAEADFDIYLQADSINLAQWFSAVELKDFPSIAGIFSGELWLARNDNAFSQIVMNASAQKLNVVTTKQSGFSLDSITAKFEWEKTDDGWYFNSRDINLTRNSKVWAESSSISAVQDEDGLVLAANYVRSQDVIEVANVLLNNEQLKIINDYQLKRFSGDFYNLSLFIPVADDESIELSTAFENIQFVVPESEIVFQGVDGLLTHSNNISQLELLSESVKMDFGDLFRQPLQVDLMEGEVLVKHEDDRWLISSDDLYILNSDLELNTRLSFSVDEQGTIFSDVQTDFSNVIGSSLHKYYPVSIMSDELVNWLDMGISDGFVDSGSFVIYGDLAQFPYPANDGVMQVVFDTRHLTLKFLEDWPSLNELKSHIRFHNASMKISDISGQTYRGKITNTNVLIPDLNSPRLLIEGDIVSPADDLQQYVWDSGLNEIVGTAMDTFQASGDIELDLKLEVPLDNNTEVLVSGDLQFKNNELYFPVMDYTLDNVTGHLLFEGDLLTANDIKATFEKAPVNIGVKTTDISDNKVFSDGKISETVFFINGRLPVQGLLKQFEWVPAGWLEGDSNWDIAIHLPKDVDDYSVRVEMDSMLEGVTIDMTDSLSKKSAELLPIKIEVKAYEDVLQLDALSKDEFTLFATRSEENIWNFVIDSSLIRGSGEFAEDLANDSVVSLDLAYIDILKLFKSSNEGTGVVSLTPGMFPSLNFKTKVLLWNDWEFNNASLESSWHSHGMLINAVSVQGPSLKINGRGSWLTSWQGGQETNLKFFVNSSNFGNTLSKLNLSQNMDRCEQSATVDWQWPGEPYRFSWQTVKGSSHFTMENGEVKALDPGAGGRIVGLFNFFKLLDRLTLDFKDVSGEGFAFDSIEGDFKFQEGFALINNIEVNAAAADMKLKGKIGMVDKDYDLLMKVKPRTSSAVFTGGTIAGGPILGAGLVLINKLFGLEKSAFDEYEITGSWDEPQVKQIGERDAEGEIEK